MKNKQKITIDNFVMIPNNAVQNLSSGELEKQSYIQLYGKRTIAYLQNLLALQNVSKQIRFSIDMILWMQGLDKGRLEREKSSLKSFLKLLQTDSLIEFSTEVNFKKSNEFMIAELDIYDYKVSEDNSDSKIVNFFMLMDSEYNLIMSYDGKLDKYNLLNLFCNIKSRIKRNADGVSPAYRESEVAYPSYERIELDINVESDKTLKEYIDALVELDLIHYDYAGDMKIKISGQTRRRNSNFTYALSSNVNWEVDLADSIIALKQKKRKDGWTFISKQDEITADEKRSITQKINVFEKMEKNNKILTQAQKKEYAKLKRKQEKWKLEYVDNVRKLEEAKLLEDNPDKKLWEIYRDMDLRGKALRALRDAGYVGEDTELLGVLDGEYNEEELAEFRGEPEIVVKSSRSILDVKGRGLQNKKPVVVDEVAVTVDATDILDEDNSRYGDYNLTDEEQQANQEQENANYDQIPEEIRREMAERDYIAHREYEDEMRNHMEDSY